MEIIVGTAYDFEITWITHTFLTIYVIKNRGIVFTVGITGKFTMCSKRDSKMFKDTDLPCSYCTCIYIHT